MMLALSLLLAQFNPMLDRQCDDSGCEALFDIPSLVLLFLLYWAFHFFRDVVRKLKQGSQASVHQVKPTVAGSSRIAAVADVPFDEPSIAARPEVDAAEPMQFVEILPALKTKYPGYVRSNITSLRLGQNKSRCYLEIHASQSVYRYSDLKNLKPSIERIDLQFIGDDDDLDGDYFSPARPLAENRRRFLEDFGEESIAHCLDVFTEAATYQIFDKVDNAREAHDSIPSSAKP